MKQFRASEIKLKRVVRWLILTLCGMIVGVGVYFFNASSLMGNQIPMPFGYGVAVVLSGSMENTLSVDDLVIIRAADDYAVNDIVLYQEDSTLVIHRIIRIDGDEIITKGDANNIADEPINKSQIKGVLVRSISGFGAVVRILKQPLSVFLILAAVVVLMELSFRKEKNKDSKTLDAIKVEIEMLKQQNDT
ncbi:MAG: signal peptidase I [Ruminococcus sp.]|nr:signal peptidase I [Ruminococcus sp.]